MIENLVLTKKQEEIVNYSGKHLLVKGVPGSGKTVVLLRKCRILLDKEPDARVGLFTYNRTLARYALGLAASFDGGRRLYVDTFHGWAREPLRELGLLTYTVTNRSQRLNKLSEAKKLLRGVQDHKYVKDRKYEQFLLDEFEWIKGRGLVEKSLYQSASRVGRGTKEQVRQDDRSIIFALFVLYQMEMENANHMEYADYALLLDRHFARVSDRHKFDYVLVDEAQDLSQMQLKVLRRIAQKGLAVAADKGQKIYRTEFSWSDVGINIRGGRTKVLRNTFRSTKQIISLAKSLQEHDPLCIQQDEDYIEPEIPDVDGPSPTVWEMTNRLEEELAIVQLVRILLTSEPDQTIGILTKTWRVANRIGHQLTDAKIPVQTLKDDETRVLEPGVKLSTMHSAKGLEFDTVILAHMNRGLVPYPADEDDEEAVAHERRLVYVSMTRAKLQLHIFYHEEPSVFIKELDGTLYEKIRNASDLVSGQ
jgi:superfamily I DNA/RNA helicase